MRKSMKSVVKKVEQCDIYASIKKVTLYCGGVHGVVSITSTAKRFLYLDELLYYILYELFCVA